MSRHTKHLFNLLLALFRSNDDLSVAINAVDYPQTQMLLNSLPSVNVSRVAFTLPAAQELKAHGIEEAFFDVLAKQFPARLALIAATRSAYLDEAPDEAELRPVDTATTPVPDSAVAAYEKIMGDRPTFLDVDYLLQGAQSAKAVVKLRMQFPQGWYSGTAFLIAPDRLLTAHHNLVADGAPAIAVTAQFDYERPLEGPEPEGMTVPCRVETIRGEAGDDWGVIDLATPQPDRRLVRFAEVAARKDDRVAIIQHPNGMPKQVALHNNLVTFADASRLQYLTDTLPGSSGAPVFDSHWRVVALHHAGGDLNLPGTKQLVYRNQGIPTGLLRERLAHLGITI